MTDVREQRVVPFGGGDQSAAVADICVRTALAGADASRLYRDPAIVPDVYATPYLVYDPGLAFVVTDGETVTGYVVATASSVAFADWFDEEWWPSRRERHPAVPGEHPDETRIRRSADDTRSGLPPAGELDAFPAHLHINLLPAARGLGVGRRLLEALFAELHRRGVGGVHLSHGGDNTGAAAFYARIGFTPLPSGTPEAPRLARVID